MSNQLQAPSLEVIKSEFSLEMSKSRYQELLQQAENITFTRDNIEQSYEPLKKLREILKVIDAVHKRGKEEALRIGKMWDNAKNDMKKPIDDVLQRKTIEYSKLAEEISQEKQRQLMEQQRVSGIKQLIETVALNFARGIAACTTSKQLVDIERLINLEKIGTQSKSKYQEFQSELIARLEGLNEAVRNQKTTVRQLEDNARKLQEAQDDETKLALQEKEEELNNQISEQKILVQEKAIDAATNVQVEVAQEILPNVKARRSTWKYEVTDINLLQKKMPHLVMLVPNEDRISDLLKNMKTIDGSLEGKEEVLMNGLRFFLEKLY